MKKWMILLLTLALMASMTAVSGLAAGEAEADADGAEPAEATEPAEEGEEEEDPFEGLVRLGEETEGCGMVKLTNQTQDNIMMINIKRSDDWQWSDNLLLDGDLLEVGESAVLCFELPEAEEPADGAEEPADEGEAPADEAEEPADGAEAEEAEPVTYDLQIIFVGWTGGSCHNVVLTDVEDAQIMRAWNSIPYLVYTSVSTGEEVDMAEAEQEIATAEYYAQQSSGGSSSGSGGGSSSGGSNSEGCVGDGALFY